MNKSTLENLKNGRSIAIIWSIEDVIDLADQDGLKVTDQEAIEILKLLERQHDCNYGITWDHISAATESYFN